MPLSLLLILGAYLWGAMPTSYLVARYWKGIDIRKYGSGNVGATNLSEQTNKVVGIAVGLFDCVGKGTLPVVLANLLDQSLSVQVSVGLVTVIGHNWSPYMGFKGGRGIATAIGVLLGFWMWQELAFAILVLGMIGIVVFKETALFTFIELLLLPVSALILSRPAELITLTVAISVILVMKRLVGNWEWPQGDSSLAMTLLYRILWDRDVRRKADWTKRGLNDEPSNVAAD